MTTPAEVHAYHEKAQQLAAERARDGAMSEYEDAGSFCTRCERVHAYCECDEYAHLLTHSAHGPGARPHPMGE